jgi:hypothetical protein
MTSVYRLCASSYRGSPSENMLHSQLNIGVSSPSTVDNEGGGWQATGPIGIASGSAFSTFVETDTRQIRAVNRGLVADEYIYYLTGDRLFRTDYTTLQDNPSYDGFVGNYWATVHTFTSMEAGRTGRNTGIYSCLLQTTATGAFKRYIVGAYNSTVAGANTWKGFRHDVEAGTTSETSATDIAFPATPSLGGVKAEIFWNNKLYFIGTTDGGVGVFNPATMTVYRLGGWPTLDIRGPHDFCVYQNRLWCLNNAERGAGGGSGIFIWEIDCGGQSGIRQAINFGTSGIGSSTSATEPFEGRCVLFTDRTYLYAGLESTINSSTYAYHFHRLLGDGSGNFSYDGRMPSVFSAGLTPRVNVFVEQNTNPDIAGNGYDAPSGQLITLMLDESGQTGCLRNQWAWNGPNNAVIVEGSLNTAGILHALRETGRSHVKNGGGERIFNPPYGGPRADITNYSAGSTTGTITVTYEIYTNPYDFPAGTPCTVQLRFDASGHMPFTRGRLRNPSVGSLSENHTVVQIASAASGQAYTMEWDYRYHGLDPYSQRPLVNLLISTTGV